MGLFQHYIVTACVVLSVPEQFEEDGQLVTAGGYYRVFAVIAVSCEDARQRVSSEVNDGEIDWGDTTIREVDAEMYSRSVSRPCPDMITLGVWYKGGRIFFPADEPESEK